MPPSSHEELVDISLRQDIKYYGNVRSCTKSPRCGLYGGLRGVPSKLVRLLDLDASVFKIRPAFDSTISGDRLLDWLRLGSQLDSKLAEESNDWLG